MNKKRAERIYAMSGTSLGVTCYRGFAPLSVLSQMSVADEYHQIHNPNGTQRNLNKKHAKEVYRFAKEKGHDKDAIWPEIILNIREGNPLTIKKMTTAKGPKDANLTFVKLQINWKLIDETKKKGGIAISRVDGNHRLYYTGGSIHKDFPPLEHIYSPFCITEGISLIEEKNIFKTINAKQKKLDVSHLLRIEQQLTPDEELWRTNKSLWLVTKLNDDKSSPFYHEVHKGGKRSRGEQYLIKQKSLVDGISQLLKSFPLYTSINRTKLLGTIINYLNAIQKTWPDEWKDKKKYKLMTNTGMQALGTFGGKLMETMALTPSSHPVSFKESVFLEKLVQLKQEKTFSWDKKSPFMEGKAGRPGAQKIADDFWKHTSRKTKLEVEI